MSTNTITFNKEQKQLVSDFIKFIDRGNELNDDPEFDIEVLIRKEDELTIIEFADKFGCDGFKHIDEEHYVETNKCVDHYIEIDPDCTYAVDTGEMTVRRIKGSKLISNVEKITQGVSKM